MILRRAYSTINVPLRADWIGKAAVSLPNLLLSTGNITVQLSSLGAFGKQLRDGNDETVCQLRDVVEGHVPQPPLNPANVCSVQICFLGEPLLGPAARGSQFANVLCEVANGLVGNLLELGAQASSLEKLHS